MIALGPRDLVNVAATIPIFWLILHIVDRIIAGLVQCDVAGTCPW